MIDEGMAMEFVSEGRRVFGAFEEYRPIMALVIVMVEFRDSPTTIFSNSWSPRWWSPEDD